MLSLAMPGEDKKGQTPNALPSERVVAKKTVGENLDWGIKINCCGTTGREKRGGHINH